MSGRTGAGLAGGRGLRHRPRRRARHRSVEQRGHHPHRSRAAGRQDLAPADQRRAGRRLHAHATARHIEGGVGRVHLRTLGLCHCSRDPQLQSERHRPGEDAGPLRTEGPRHRARRARHGGRVHRLRGAWRDRRLSSGRRNDAADSLPVRQAHHKRRVEERRPGKLLRRAWRHRPGALGTRVNHRFSDHAGPSGGFEFVLKLWKRRKWVALLTFAAVSAGIISLAVSLPDLYRASATVLIERQQISEAFVRPSVTEELETRIRTIQQEVLSRTRLTAVITRFDLYRDFRKKGVPFEAIVERMRHDIQLDLQGVDQQMSGRNSTIAFAITYSGQDPQTVATVANALAALYVEENTKSREGQAVQTAEFLKAQLADVKNEMDAQARRSSEFKLQHMGELPQQVEANLASLERLNTQLRLNSEHQIRALDRRERLEKQLGDGGPPAPVAPPVTMPSAQLAKLKQELNDLRRQFTDESPDVMRLRAEIAALERQLPQTSPAPIAVAALADPVRRLTQDLGDLDAELRTLKDEERMLRQTIVGYEQRVENAPKRQEEVPE